MKMELLGKQTSDILYSNSFGDFVKGPYVSTSPWNYYNTPIGSNHFVY